MPFRWKEPLLVLVSCLVGGLLLFAGAGLLIGSHPSFRRPPDSKAENQILRLFAPQDSTLPFKVLANFEQTYETSEFRSQIFTNNVGMREREDYHGEPVDIGFVGDSFTFGLGVEFGERYSDQLRKHFPKRRILSYSWPNGNYPIDYYLYLKAYPELRPKLCVLGLFLGNDLTNDPTNHKHEWDPDGKAINSYILPLPPPLSTRIPQWIPGAHWLLHQAYRNPIFQGAYALYGRYFGKTVTHLAADETKATELTPLDRGKLEGLALNTLKHIHYLHEMLGSEGKKLIVFIIPEANRMWQHPMCPYRAKICERLFQERSLQQSIVSWLEARGIPAIDPTREFQAKNSEKNPLYYYWDGHWTARGHELASEILVDFLKRDQPAVHQSMIAFRQRS